MTIPLFYFQYKFCTFSVSSKIHYFQLKKKLDFVDRACNTSNCICCKMANFAKRNNLVNNLMPGGTLGWLVGAAHNWMLITCKMSAYLANYWCRYGGFYLKFKEREILSSSVSASHLFWNKSKSDFVHHPCQVIWGFWNLLKLHFNMITLPAERVGFVN